MGQEAGKKGAGAVDLQPTIPKSDRLLACLALLAALSTASAQADWRLVGEGDCPGRQVIGSLGVEPEAEHCTPEFAGKTAICFTQVCNPGCQYIDIATADCRGGTETALIYTCDVSVPPPQPAGK